MPTKQEQKLTSPIDAWASDPELVAELNDQFDRAIGAYTSDPKLVAEHANLEESIRVGGYANRTLLELVQNAADAMAGNTPGVEDAGRVEIVLDLPNRVLYCANSGRPFSRSGLEAMSHAYLSAKRGDEIGRFGLGFKSVLALSDFPQVFSRSISFEYNSASARHAIEKVGEGNRRLPVLRTATPIDAEILISKDPILGELAGWATTVVRLPKVTGLDRVQNDMRSFASEFLLFVSAVREVHLRVIGDEGFETSHISRNLGDGLFKIERPDGSGDEWIVEERMHSPSLPARREVGEAVSRDKIKVSVAIPLKPRRAGWPEKEDRGTQVGQFWSYFPLQDNTSATGFFNAPWSVNDDRTTLLHNSYNREILRFMAKIFVDLMPRISTESDRAAHFDYLPARGREERSYGDSILCMEVPRLAGISSIIPDGAGALRVASELTPLDFTVVEEFQIDEDAHRAWSNSPHTSPDVPHPKCYSSSQRILRLSEVFAATADPDLFFDDPGPRGRRIDNTLRALPKRGLLTWLREWADGPDTASTANAFRFVYDRRANQSIREARVIPTSGGFKGLKDKNEVFLSSDQDLEFENSIFVEPAFLEHREIESLLRSCGFRDLDPVAILSARISKLVSSDDHDLQRKFWDAVASVNAREASDVIRSNPQATVLVPTRDGGWAWPQQVIDLDEPLPAADGRALLDRQRCDVGVAHGLGVIRRPLANFPYEDESASDEYQAWALEAVNSRLGQGERPIENITLYPRGTATPGPFSALLMLADSAAPDATREEWTRGLLEHGDALWDCEDTDTGSSYAVLSPVRWAVNRAGVVKSSRGFRPPTQTVSPSLIKFDGLLPLYRGPRQAEELLSLPTTLDAVPAPVLREALNQEIYPANLANDVLNEFILSSSPIAYPGSHPPRVPARVNRSIESKPPILVYLATNDDQEEYLRSKQRPFLRVPENQVHSFVQFIGCRRFEDSFSFTMVIEGQQEPQRILDVFTGLRTEHGTALSTYNFARALQIAKRVTTEDGVEDHPQDWHLEGSDLSVRGDADDRQVLQFMSDAFDLRLNNAQISQILQAGLNNKLELLRKQAQTIESDRDRLDHYIGPDDLKDALPAGLWSALEAQGLVDEQTSIADLFLTVYGSDSLRILADRFRDEGFSDVPAAWAGTPAAISWVRKMGFNTSFAGQRAKPRPEEFIVPGAVRLNKLHRYQKKISEDLRTVLTQPSHAGPHQKAMVELPTGAGKTRVATETVLRLFSDEVLAGTVLWIAQSAELCEQAVQTFEAVWRYLGDERPLTVGRLWDTNTVHEPDTELAVIVATDAKIEAIMDRDNYSWLKNPTAVFVDEAHRAGGSARYTEIFRWLGVDGRSWERPLVGLSATPFKGSAGATSGTKDLVTRFGSNRLQAFKADAYQELVKLGVLANVRHEVLESGIDVPLNHAEQAFLKTNRLIDRNLYERIGRSEKRMRVVVEHILNQDPSWPVLVFTPSVLSAQVLAASINYRQQGVKAASVSGQTGRQERRDIISRFQNGEIQVLANCDLLVQGFDAPGVRALYIARPTFSPGAYIQMAGRGLRGPENGGKEECLIVDVEDNWGAMNDFLGFKDYEELWQKQGQGQGQTQ